MAFRDTTGKVGFLAENCPHRGASLFFGRNEEAGLRCVYHGWKFGTSGGCVDMPNEPPESNFKHKVHATAYAGQQWGGVIWIYMGPADLRPEVPQFEFGFVPESQRVISRWHQECNYAQGMEGDLDTTHVSFMHKQFDGNYTRTFRRRDASGQPFITNDGAPKLTIKETDYGYCYGARRSAGDEGFYWRVTQFLLPGYSLIPSANSRRSGGSWIPVDDERCTGWRFSYDLGQSYQESERSDAGGVPRLIPGTRRPLANMSNDYLIDREMQKSVNFSGILRIREQDLMGTEAMGPVMDRTREHLGTADTAVIYYRRLLLKLARQLEHGIEPWAPAHGDAYRVRALDTLDAADELEPVLVGHAGELVGAG